MRIRARHFTGDQRIDVLVHEGVIQSIEPATTAPADHESAWVAPPLFDLQINGAGGVSFNSPDLTLDRIRLVVSTCKRHGIGSFCPTLITGPRDALCHAFATLASACAADVALARAMPVFHLEGPYISPEDGPRGAHPRAHVRPPDWEEFRRFQDAAQGRIRLVTLAPESADAVAFVERLRDAGVVVAIGHTAASPELIRDAIRAGARLSTHLGNGSHAHLPRHENYFLEQLASDELWASIICDGHHLPASLVRIITRVKSPKRLILTSDASSLAGLPPGRYREWDQEIDVCQDGKIIVPGTSYLAGSWAFTDLCLENMLKSTQVSLAEAIDMAANQPRRLLDLPLCELSPGRTADLLLFDWQPGEAFKIQSLLLAGTV